MTSSETVAQQDSSAQDNSSIGAGASEAAATGSHDMATAEPHSEQAKERQAPAASTKGSPVPASATNDKQQSEQPSARRERKQTAFFQPEAKAENTKLEIKTVHFMLLAHNRDIYSRLTQATRACWQGQGKKLGDIPNIAFRLSKVTGKDELLEDLHQICYGSKGKVCVVCVHTRCCCQSWYMHFGLFVQMSVRKKEIQAFSGFTVEEGKLVGFAACFADAHFYQHLQSGVLTC